MDENLTARFVVPVVMENVFAVFINMAISGVISTISASALAAISMANSIMSVVSALFSMVTTGSSARLAVSNPNAPVDAVVVGIVD
jgi:Na+-driven multidrug efflux pump